MIITNSKPSDIFFNAKKLIKNVLIIFSILKNDKNNLEFKYKCTEKYDAE